ncbi:hypothetical protein LTS18_012391, partial [Coniosporium uncinatum]
IAEQLNQSEKLYKDLNQTWEEKLAKTEEIHKEREAALEELGISIEKGFIGVSTPKKMPHLVNLSDDPLLAECLVYNLKPGTTTVGNVDTTGTAEIRLNGSKILHDHCTFENVDGAVTVVPKDNASIMVNGVRIDKPKRLHSGFRIILGDFHIFRFNHPQEAREERAERGQSMLRHAIVPDRLGSPSPSRRAGHERSHSAMSFVDADTDQWSDGVATPNYFSKPGAGRDSDWSFARREAVSALLGPDQRMSNLTDEELDVLFEDLQRVRADRKGKTESRVFVGDDDQDSSSSYPVREKYASNGTLDNFSLDTALTIPTTPQIDEEDERLRFVREELQTQLERQKDEYQARLKSAEESNVEIEEVRVEKAKMEESLLAVREDMQKQLQAQKDDFERQRRELAEQKEEYERQLSELRQPIEPTPPESSGSTALLPQQKEQARIALNRWQQRRYVAMAETILQSAATLKEAQVMSQQMDKHVVFQFCIVDVGHTTVSSYDLVLNDVSGEGDEDLDVAPKPCVA